MANNSTKCTIGSVLMAIPSAIMASYEASSSLPHC